MRLNKEETTKRGQKDGSRKSPPTGPIIVKFTSYRVRASVLSNRKKLKGTRIRIDEKSYLTKCQTHANDESNSWCDLCLVLRWENTCPHTDHRQWCNDSRGPLQGGPWKTEMSSDKNIQH